MSSIMRARSAVTGWGERGEVIGGSSRAEGCWTFNARDRMPRSSPLTAHPLTASAKNAPAPTPLSRESGFVQGWRADHPRWPAPNNGLAPDSGRSASPDATARFDPTATHMVALYALWFVQLQADGLIVDSLGRAYIAALASRHAVPAIAVFRDFPDAGGLLSYGPSFAAAYRIKGIYA